MSNTVTGHFTYTVDGVEKRTNFASLPYGSFAIAQALVIGVMQTTSLWGMAGALGIDPPGPPSDGSIGDVEFGFVADFSAGGYSEGHNEWHGIPAAAAQAIAAELDRAASYLQQ